MVNTPDFDSGDTGSTPVRVEIASKRAGGTKQRGDCYSQIFKWSAWECLGALI